MTGTYQHSRLHPLTSTFCSGNLQMTSMSHEFSRTHSAPVCEIVELRKKCFDITSSMQRTRSCVEGSPTPTEPTVFDQYFGARVAVGSKQSQEKETESALGLQEADIHINVIDTATPSQTAILGQTNEHRKDVTSPPSHASPGWKEEHVHSTSVFHEQEQSVSAAVTPLKQTDDSTVWKRPNAFAASQDLTFLDHTAILDASERIPDPDLSVVVRRVKME
eukprot:3886364-Rhodomonas_salina.3